MAIALEKSLCTEVVAYSEPAGAETPMAVRHSPGLPINWRESLRCGLSGLNNRSRASMSLLQRMCALTPSSAVYITEQTTPFWRYLKANYPNAKGSEFRDRKYAYGEEIEGVRNEDLTALTFAEHSFDIVASFDCLEHIPDYSSALGQILRVLRSGGVTLLTFPFTGRQATLVRASITESGEVLHRLPPEYHGDPVNPSHGILCYYHFGFDILDIMKQIGFRDAFVYWIWGHGTGNLGGLQPYIIGTK